MSLYTVLSRADNRVANVFQKLTVGVDKERMEKVTATIEALEKTGKSVERAMADALETYKLSGAVNAGNANV